MIMTEKVYIKKFNDTDVFYTDKIERFEAVILKEQLKKKYKDFTFIIVNKIWQ